MSRRVPERASYHFPNVDFGAASDTTFGIKVPIGGFMSSHRNTGQAGRVVQVLIHNVTEIFNGTSSDSAVQVGDGTDVDVYYDSGLTLNNTVGSETTHADDGSQIDIPAGRDDVVVTCVASVGTPTGIGDLSIDIEWY